MGRMICRNSLFPAGSLGHEALKDHQEAYNHWVKEMMKAQAAKLEAEIFGTPVIVSVQNGKTRDVPASQVFLNDFCGQETGEEMSAANPPVGVDKVRITLSFLDGYTTVLSQTLEQNVICMAGDDEILESDVIHTLNRLQNDFNSVANNFPVGDRLAEEKQKAEIAEAVKEATAGESPTWKLNARIAELEKELARKSCQLDGVIQSVNPDYKPSVD